MRLRWTTPATQDPYNIIRHIQRGNPNAAAKVAETLYVGCGRLLDFPRQGRRGGYRVATSKHPRISIVKTGPNKKPSRQSERVCELVGEILCGAHDVTRLKAFRAFEQIELDGLAFIQRAVSVLLDGGEMYEDILARGALDEPVSLRPVEPLHSTLLSHKKLLSPQCSDLFFRRSSVPQPLPTTLGYRTPRSTLRQEFTCWRRCGNAVPHQQKRLL